MKIKLRPVAVVGMLLTMILLLSSVVATSTLPQVQAPSKTQKQRQLKPTREGQPDPSVLNSWEELKSRSGQSLTASWNESGTPRSIFGKIDKGHGSSEGSARAFVSRGVHRRELGVRRVLRQAMSASLHAFRSGPPLHEEGAVGASGTRRALSDRRELFVIDAALVVFAL